MESLTYTIALTDDMVDDILFYQELERERAACDWEAPFPMDTRTQQDMQENMDRVVREGIARFSRFMTTDPGPLGLFMSPF